MTNYTSILNQVNLEITTIENQLTKLKDLVSSFVQPMPEPVEDKANWYTIEEVAKRLGISRDCLMQFMVNIHWLFRRSSDSPWLPYDPYVKRVT